MLAGGVAGVGCLYYSASREAFVLPKAGKPLDAEGITPHWGRPGGVFGVSRTGSGER